MLFGPQIDISKIQNDLFTIPEPIKASDAVQKIFLTLEVWKMSRATIIDMKSVG